MKETSPHARARRTARRRLAPAAVATGVVGALAALTFGTGTARAADSIGTFTIYNGQTNASRAIDVPGNVAQWGRQLQVYQSNGTTAQQWKYVPVDRPASVAMPGQADWSIQAYKIINAGNGLCMEAAGAAPTVGSIVDEYGCDPNYVDQPNQIWYSYQDPSSYRHFLVNASSVPPMKNQRPSFIETDPNTEAITVTSPDNVVKPALVVESDYRAQNAPLLSLDQGVTYGAAQVFSTYQIASPPSSSGGSGGGGGGGGPTCIGFACLVSLS